MAPEGRLLDAELAAELDAEAVEMEPYEFEELPGFPAPQTAVRRASYYEYQTAGDYWDMQDEWPDGRPPFELQFSTSMTWYALVLLGATEHSQVPPYDVYSEEGNLRGDPRYDEAGWLLEDSDRDLFLRIERLYGATSGGPSPGVDSPLT